MNNELLHIFFFSIISFRAIRNMFKILYGVKIVCVLELTRVHAEMLKEGKEKEIRGHNNGDVKYTT